MLTLACNIFCSDSSDLIQEAEMLRSGAFCAFVGFGTQNRSICFLTDHSTAKSYCMTLHKCAVALDHRDIVVAEAFRQRDGPSQLLLLSQQNLIVVPQWLKKNPFFSNKHQRPSPSLCCAPVALFAIKTERQIRVTSAVVCFEGIMVCVNACSSSLCK